MTMLSKFSRKKICVLVAVASAFPAGSLYAANNFNRLIVSGWSNSDPGVTLITYDPNTGKYYSGTRGNSTEIPGGDVISVDVSYSIDNARLDMWGYDAEYFGGAKEFQLNFQDDVTLNRGMENYNGYGAIYLNNYDFDLSLNVANDKTLTIDAKEPLHRGPF